MPERTSFSDDSQSSSKKLPQQNATVFVPSQSSKKKGSFEKRNDTKKQKDAVYVPKKRRRWLTALILFLIMLFLATGAFVVWMYGDSLGIDVQSFSQGIIKQEMVESEKDEVREKVDQNTSLLDELQQKIDSLSDSSGSYVSKSEYAQDITKIESYLKKVDTDGDGVSDFDEEAVFGTNPEESDTDGDGFSDGEEIAAGFNPNGEGKLDISKIQQESSMRSIIGSYAGAFSLTDVEVSSNDIKLEVGDDNAASGSFTFEYQGSPYRVELTGVYVVGSENLSMNFDSSMISGTELEEFKTMMTLQETDEGYEGEIRFVESDQEFLNDQEGIVSFKPFGSGSADNINEDADFLENNTSSSE